MVKKASFIHALNRAGALYLDTSLLIYQLEDILPYSALTEVVFNSIENKKHEGHISVLSILELNVKPYQLGQSKTALTQVSLLKNLPHMTIHPIDLETADKAAQFRARYRLKTPDAIHASCAWVHRCQTIIGNDKEFSKVKETSYLHLDHFL
ncbi:MAG TPA: PIN domain-containing protein [bacterium]|nr:PIN domain-containing protein [bacterium]